MNINLTLFVQIFNIFAMLFLLKKILIEKTLEVVNRKKLDCDIITQQISEKKESIKNLVSEHASLWEKFKKRAVFSIENANKANNYTFNNNDYSEEIKNNNNEQPDKTLINTSLQDKIANKIIKTIREIS